MEKYNFKGKTQEETLKKALESLNLEEKDVLYSFNEIKSGLLKTKMFEITIVKIEDIVTLGKEKLKQIIDGLGYTSNIESKVRDNLISYLIFSPNSGHLIGKNGRILSSIQIYLKNVLKNETGFDLNLIIDVENYKVKKQGYLIRNVKKLARDVLRNKVDIKLDPMNSFERRLVHETLSKHEKLKTISEGKEPNRYVVIKYVDNKEK